jgi:integrase
VGKYRGVIRRGAGWQISFVYQGQRYRKILRFPPTAKGEKEAYDRLCSIQSDIVRGVFETTNYRNTNNNEQPSAHWLITHSLTKWMTLNEKRLELSTRQDYQRRIDKHLLPTFGHLQVRNLTRTHIQEWLSQTKLSSKSQRNTLCPLISTFTWLEQEGVITSNPTKRIKFPRLDTREPRPFSKLETDAILLQLPCGVRNYFAIAFLTGLRTSELIALTWEDVLFDQGKLRVNKAKVRGQLKKTKTKAGTRFVDIDQTAHEYLRAQMSHRVTDEVFFDPDLKTPWKDDKKLRVTFWRPALKRAKVDYREPYQTRHTFASDKLSVEKVSPIYLATQMGHSNCEQVYKNYARWIENNSK